MAQPDTPASFSVRVGDRLPPSVLSTPLSYQAGYGLGRSHSTAHSDFNSSEGQWAPQQYKQNPMADSRKEQGRNPRAQNIQVGVSRDGASSLHRPIREVESGELESGDGGSEAGEGTPTTKLLPLQICLRLAQFIFSLVAFSLVCALQRASHSVALEVRPFAFLLSMSLISWTYSFSVMVFLVTVWWRKVPAWIEKIQKIFMHIDFVLLVLLFSAASTTAAVFPLYCYIGSKARHAMFHGGPTPSDICDNIFESSMFGILGAFSFIGQFWFVLTPFIWKA